MLLFSHYLVNFSFSKASQLSYKNTKITLNSYNNSFFIGKVLHELERVDSTNSYALNLLSKQKVSEGTVISTKEQFAGRGQMGSSWQSAIGKNLTLSIILQPKFLNIKDQYFLNMAIALGVHATVQTIINKPVFIKWPNDIYINNEKIGGILIQNTLNGSFLQNSVIGIGLNINQTVFPEHLPNPTSLSLSGNKSYDLLTIRQQLFKNIEAFYLQLKGAKKVLLKAQYLDKLYRYNEILQFKKADDSLFLGKIIDVANSGALVIANAHTNQTEEYLMKEISFA